MKTFTPTQAHALLPILQKEMQQLQPKYKNLRALFEECASENNMPVDDARLREVCLADEGIRELFFEVEESLCFFSELGVECRSIEKGQIDFPCLFSDRIVFLCWTVGEPSITHWHEVDQEFSSRQPLFGSVELGEEFDRLTH